MKKGERETVEKDKKSIKATEKEKIPSLKERKKVSRNIASIK